MNKTAFDIPWHKCGKQLEEFIQAEHAICAAGLDWRTVKKQLFVGDEHRLLPGHYVLVREDLWSQGRGGILGMVRADYIPLQNAEAFSLFDGLVGAGVASYDRAGVLAEGKWVWIILRFRGDLQIGPNDSIAQFLLFGNSPTNGSYKLVYLPVRLACGSTLAGGSFHNPSPQITLPRIRPRRFQISIDDAIQEIQRRFLGIAEQFRAMNQVKMSEAGFEEYLKAVLGDWLKKKTGYSEKEPSAELIAEVEQDRDECSRLFLEGMGNDMLSAERTLWAAVNVFTRYVDFYKLNPSDPMYLNEIWFNELKGSALTIARNLMLS